MDDTTQQNNQPKAPTWADFKPPVSTTPFGMGVTPPQPAGDPVNPAFISNQSPESASNQPPPLQTLPPQSSVTAYPWMNVKAPEAGPAPTSQLTPSTPPVAEPAPIPAEPVPPTQAAVPSPVEPAPAPAPSFSAPITQAPAPVPSFAPPMSSPPSMTPPAPSEPTSISASPLPEAASAIPTVPSPAPAPMPSFIQSQMQPPVFNQPTPVSVPAMPTFTAPVTPEVPPAASVVSTPIPSVPETPAAPEPTTSSSVPPISFVQSTPTDQPNLGVPEYLSPQPEPAPAPPAPPAPPLPTKPAKKSSALPIVAGAVVLAGIVVAAGYFVYTKYAPHPAATLGAQTVAENKDILAKSMGPDSWVNDFSTSLLSVERGGLELLMTDPPHSVKVTPLATSAATAAATPAATPVVQTVGSEKVDLKSLTVRVAKAEVHLATQTVVADGPSPDATKSASKAIDRWETLRLNDSTDVDLMDLRNRGGVLSSLGITYLAAGHYTETRLYITAATAVLTDGTTLQLPITDQNGILKVTKGFDLSVTNASKMVVDFDAPHCVTKDASGYHFSPVLSKFVFNDQQL